MAEYSRIAKGHFTSTGSAQIINLPFQPDSVEMWNYTLANSAATSQNIISANWDASMGQGQAIIQGYNATPALIYDVVSTNGISTFSAGLAFQYGTVQLLGGSGGIVGTSATVTTITTTSAHGLTTGNWVVFSNLYQTATTGMNQFAGIPFQVTVTGPTLFTIYWNATGLNYTTITAGGLNANASFKQILYPVLYAPEQSIVAAVSTTNNVTTVTTTAPHNFQVGQEIAFRIPSTWGPTQLNSLPDVVIPGSPLYFYVATVPTSTTFTLPTGSGVVYTAFNANQTFASAGRTFPQVVPAGDVNTGGYPYAGGALYPSPTVYNGYGTNAVSSINGPAIQGSYINNTSQGFIIGSGAGRVLTTGSLVGANTNVIYWRAYQSDLVVN